MGKGLLFLREGNSVAQSQSEDLATVVRCLEERKEGGQREGRRRGLCPSSLHLSCTESTSCNEFVLPASPPVDAARWPLVACTLG